MTPIPGQGPRIGSGPVDRVAQATPTTGPRLDGASFPLVLPAVAPDRADLAGQVVRAALALAVPAAPPSALPAAPASALPVAPDREVPPAPARASALPVAPDPGPASAAPLAPPSAVLVAPDRVVPGLAVPAVRGQAGLRVPGLGASADVPADRRAAGRAARRDPGATAFPATAPGSGPTCPAGPRSSSC